MPPRRNKSLQAIAAEADRITAPIRQKRGLAEAALISDWPDIIGTALAAECMPLRIARGADGTGGTLHIRVSGALALELQHLQPQVIERINGYFGYHAIGRIALQQGPIHARKPAARPPAPPPSDEDAAALAAQLDTIADDDLRQALDALGRGILSRKQRRAASDTKTE
ncbi:MAG: DUF721 domain-containing protein [Alphaproteobacteria bacterium]|nr:DUF721 domain-containing protein [Alphaproteobacteria bacterium]